MLIAHQKKNGKKTLTLKILTISEAKHVAFGLKVAPAEM